MKRILAVALLALVAACSAPTAPDYTLNTVQECIYLRNGQIVFAACPPGR